MAPRKGVGSVPRILSATTRHSSPENFCLTREPQPTRGPSQACGALTPAVGRRAGSWQGSLPPPGHSGRTTLSLPVYTRSRMTQCKSAGVATALSPRMVHKRWPPSPPFSASRPSPLLSFPAVTSHKNYRGLSPGHRVCFEGNSNRRASQLNLGSMQSEGPGSWPGCVALIWDQHLISASLCVLLFRMR